MQCGITASDPADLAAKAEQFGVVPEEVRVYLTEPPTAAFWTEWDGTLDGVKLLVVSFKADPNEVARGMYDADVAGFGEAWAQARRQGSMPTVRLVYWHEPEDDIEKGTFTLAEWRAATSHVHALYHSTGIILEGYTLSPASKRNVADYVVPGLAWYGFDCYPEVGGQAEGVPVPGTMAWPTSRAIPPFAVKYGVHWALTEFGTHTEEGRPAWFGEVAKWAAAAGAECCSLFASEDSPTGAFWPLDEASVEAWAELL